MVAKRVPSLVSRLETIHTKFGFHIDHPIVSDLDLRRAGWILAIGMSNMEPVTIFVGLSLSLTSTWPFSEEDAVCRRAVTPVLRVLKESFDLSFPRSHGLASTIKAVEQMTSLGTDSGAYSSLERSKKLLPGSFYKEPVSLDFQSIPRDAFAHCR